MGVGWRAGHKKSDAIVPAEIMSCRGRVMDMADAVVAMESLRRGSRPNPKDRSVVELGVTGAMFLPIPDLVGQRVCENQQSWKWRMARWRGNGKRKFKTGIRLTYPPVQSTRKEIAADVLPQLVPHDLEGVRF